MLTRTIQHMHQTGSSLIEVLVTIVIVAFGLLGLAGFLIQVQNAEWESYQRAQALNILNDMAERISVNSSAAASYLAASIGTGDTQPDDCSGSAVGTPERDLCEWSNKLKGASETKNGSAIGAMESARGCIGEVQAPDATAGVCRPGIYQVSVAWQGRNPTVAPNSTCGQNLYGDDKTRRVISQAITVALLTCN